MAGTPMIDDLALAAVQWIRQETIHGYVRQDVAGLAGTLHQNLGRRSHRVTLAGVLLPPGAMDDLKTLQEKAASGAEVSFTADITSALSVDKMVIESFAAEQRVGPSGQVAYRVVLAESPPLPPPAELSPFGGLGEFGLGDLGFDAGALGNVLGDISNQAGAVMGTLDSALAAVEGVAALANLADLGNIGNPLKPITERVGELAPIGPAVEGLAGSLGNLIP